MRIVVASGNGHKISEIKSILSETGAEVISYKELTDSYVEPDESGDTLRENAFIKAKSIRDMLNDETVIADDSGLFVDALEGEPGVHSARYAGEPCDDKANNEKLIKKLAGKERGAAFRSVICMIDDAGEHYFEGEIRGTVLYEPRGKGGFGYDPYFLPDGYDKSFAEMTSEEKNFISHRSRALSKLLEYLKNKS